MWTAIVWVGQYGSWSKGGFETQIDAEIAGLVQIASGAFGDRSDLVVEAVQR